MNWKKFYSSIPNMLKIKKQRYEVLWIDGFTDYEDTLGESRFDTHQIVIHTSQTPKQSSSTFIHELLHVIAHEYEMTLTENQVLTLEKGIVNFLSANNVSLKFDAKRKKDK